MRLSQLSSVTKRRKDKKFGGSRGKKKHKRLDAISEEAYNRSHEAVENMEGSELCGGNELELRRSTRVRKAPVLLDASPPPPKKRRRVSKGGEGNSIDKGKRGDGVKSEMPGLSLRDLDGDTSGWQSRLRSRGKCSSSRRSGRGSFSPVGKRKLLEDCDGGKDHQLDDGKEDLVGVKSTIVKSKRPGRIKASNVLTNDNQEIELVASMEEDRNKNAEEVELVASMEEDRNKNAEEVELVASMEEDRNKNIEEVLEVRDERKGLCLEIDSESGKAEGVDDGNVASQLCQNEEIDVQVGLQLEECQVNGDVETMEHNMQVEEISGDVVESQGQAVEAGGATANQIKDEENPDKTLEDENSKKLNEVNLNIEHGKLRLKQGRRCGLCGGGTDGKPSKILQDGAGSDNEVYSGSSASEDGNYDIWDGFGDESGWLGRLLGPVNDRFGIAGIWVHQQCAVWSPEVYFAGLGCLKNVRAALFRGRALKCTRCRRPGATIGCRVDRCPRTYHLPCARANGCVFDHRKFLIACTDHRRHFQPHGSEYLHHIKKMKAKKMKLELRKLSNDAWRKDIEAEEKWLEKCGEDEEFLKRESRRLHRDLCRIAPVYIGGANCENEKLFQGWESVAGLQDVIRCMKEVVILPLLYPELFDNLGLTPPRGVLLHGYPGTGKTLVVRALIGSCARGDKRIAYFARKGADCLGKYVGDAERQLRLLFQVAEKSQPSIIFFDEIDGLAPCRSKHQDQTHSSVVSTLLALMDGLKSRGSVVVIGATNRPDAVDPALRRPGRFDREIYFPLPSVKDREAILSLHTQKWPKPITGSLLKWVARQTVGYAGADLQALCTQAAIVALRRSFPLKEVLSIAGAKACQSNCPVPIFTVEERDWLEALSRAPPPCSRREAGIAAHDVVSSPLDTHLIPCLLQPLARLIISLYLNEHVWLPPPLKKAASFLQNVIVSALDRKGLQSDSWWLHANDMLLEADLRNEIERNLSLDNILIGRHIPSADALGDNADDGCSESWPSNMQFAGGRFGLLHKKAYASGNLSGFQVLISGNPRSGQRHLASCLLHSFVGNAVVLKVDLASISQEGHGDMVHGLTQILMRCASLQSCVMFMPRIDLWAVERFSQTWEDDNESASEEKPCPNVKEAEMAVLLSALDNPSEVEEQEKLSASSSRTEMADSETDVNKATSLWNLFIEQVDSIRVRSSLMILATAGVPVSLLPASVKQFFENESVNYYNLSCLATVPRFSVELDGSFGYEAAIDSFSMKLSNDLAQNIVEIMHHRDPIHANLFKEKEASSKVEGGSDRTYDSNNPGSVTVLDKKSLSPGALSYRTAKGKPSLLLAISTFGYQILCYPHFAELCWVTSKLKEGPCADVSGPWKGWPFNSCIIRPINSTEKVAVTSGSSDSKNKESLGLVRGLVAVGLSAYRGEYTSLRETSSEVRQVLELLVERINGKIQSGKDRYQYTRLLSQVSYLEDMVINWAYTLQSLEVAAQVSEVNPKPCTGHLDNQSSCDKVPSEGDDCKPDFPNGTLHDLKKLEENTPDSDAKDAGFAVLDNRNGDCSCGGKVGEDTREPLELVVPNQSESPPPNELNSGSTVPKDVENHVDPDIGIDSVKHSNGFREKCFDLQDGTTDHSDENNAQFLVEKRIADLCSVESCDRANMTMPPNSIPSPGIKDHSVGHDLSNQLPESGNLPTGASITCLYQCCPECLIGLKNIVRRTIVYEWGRKGSDFTVEGFHDFVAALSAKLHLAVSKLSLAESSIHSQDRNLEQNSDSREYFECDKTDMPRCKNSGKGLPMECSCHAPCENVTEANCFQNPPRGLDLKFIFRDGVLSTLDTGSDVSYHCKFDKLCLSFLIESIAMSKELLD